MLTAALLLAATLTVEDYATMPQVAGPQWSPDGTRIAYVVTKADLARSVYDSDVWLIDTDGKNDRRLTFANGTDTRPRWSPDGTRLAFVSDRGGRNAIYLLDPRGGEARAFTSEPTGISDFEWSPDGKQIAFTRVDEPTAEEEKRIAAKDDARVVGEIRRYAQLYVADVDSGKSRKLTTGNATTFDFNWSPDGSEIVVSRSDKPGLDGLHSTDLHIVSVRDGAMRPLVVRPGHDRSPRWSPDGKTIAFTSAGGIAHWMVEFDIHTVPASGGEPKRISAAYDRTPDDHEWTEDGRGLWIHGAWNATTSLFRINADGTGFTKTLDAEASDADIHRSRIAYIRQSFTSPPELFVDQQQLTHHNDAYRNRELGETRVIRWKNPTDGLEIEGLLTLPVGYKSGRVPLLTFVHGGPASRFDNNYLGYLGHIYAPQTLASKGFAVLRPNPRGTGGYGRAFRIANRNDWGGLDWVDINSGIDKVIADGIADPQRLGLMGWSYGGFIASWALGHSDRFRAISIGAPLVDLLSFHGTTDIREFIPSYFEGMSLDLLRAHSPAWHLKKTNAKVLIQHGEADDRVPLSQGTILYRLLDELGVDVTMVTYPRTPHVPREPKLRIDVAKRNVEFFITTIK
ncbi:MAG TPA: S9 family peptidase [Thermoanaerobaculia bacterium]|jgi:dipeptidyl aminopeptidase/acylaminoacyl peptidase|nr:S9 family peptidase [Thermoanaerobaculia bacterium]